MLSRRQVLNLKWRATFVALAILGLFYFGPSLPAGKCSARSRIGRSLLNTDEGQVTASCEMPNCEFPKDNITEFNKEVKKYFKCHDDKKNSLALNDVIPSEQVSFDLNTIYYICHCPKLLGFNPNT